MVLSSLHVSLVLASLVLAGSLVLAVDLVQGIDGVSALVVLGLHLARMFSLRVEKRCVPFLAFFLGLDLF